MNCAHCEAELLRTFSFCPSCGKTIDRERLEAGTQLRNGAAYGNSGSPGRSKSTTTSNTPCSSTSGCKNKKRQLTFTEFQAQKGRERTDGKKMDETNCKQKKQKRQRVTVNIGVMAFDKKGNFKPVRAKYLMVKAWPEYNKYQLLSEAVKKHSNHDRSFSSVSSEWTLVYPDGREVFTIPGKDDVLFTLEGYKQEMCKAYNRISLYLAKPRDVLKASGKSNENHTDNEEEWDEEDFVQSGESFANVRILSDGPQVDSALCRNSHMDLHTLTEIFPGREEDFLRTAIATTSSLEEAVQLIAEDSGASLHDTYANLCTEDVGNDDLIISPESYFVKEETVYCTDKSIQKLLNDHAKKFLCEEEYTRMKVRRNNIWSDTCVKLDNMTDSDLYKPFKIQFVGEPAVDQGGPSREFFSLINQHMQRTMLYGSTFRHNVVSLQKDEFMKFGRLSAKGLLQGSAGPRCFGKTVTDYILYGDIKYLEPTLDEVPPGELKDSLEKLHGIGNAEEFKTEASFNSDFRFDHGYTKPIVTLDDKDEFIKAIALHAIIFTSLHELNQFIEGLKTCDILDLLRCNPEQFRAVLQYGETNLTAELLDDVFQPLFSPEGSNKRDKEECLVFNFNQMLENVENGKIVEEFNGTDITITLSHILMFVTGASQIPAIGLSPRPSIRFDHNTSVERKLFVSTCANVLTLPVSDKLFSLEGFEKEFVFCMLNSPGFGNV